MPKRTPWGHYDDQCITDTVEGRMNFIQLFEALPNRSLSTLRRHYQMHGDPVEQVYYERGMRFGSTALLWKLHAALAKREAGRRAAAGC